MVLEVYDGKIGSAHISQSIKYEKMLFVPEFC